MAGTKMFWLRSAVAAATASDSLPMISGRIVLGVGEGSRRSPYSRPKILETGATTVLHSATRCHSVRQRRSPSGDRVSWIPAVAAATADGIGAVLKMKLRARLVR